MAGRLPHIERPVGPRHKTLQDQRFAALLKAGRYRPTVRAFRKKILLIGPEAAQSLDIVDVDMPVVDLVGRRCRKRSPIMSWARPRRPRGRNSTKSLWSQDCDRTGMRPSRIFGASQHSSTSLFHLCAASQRAAAGSDQTTLRELAEVSDRFPTFATRALTLPVEISWPVGPDARQPQCLYLSSARDRRGRVCSATLLQDQEGAGGPQLSRPAD